MAVRAPDDLVTLTVQMFDDLQRNAGGDHPVGPCFHRCRGIGIDHHDVIGVGIAEGGELVDGTTQIKRALGLQRRHQHPLVGAQDLGGLSHEAHTGHDRGLGCMVATEAGHLQGVTHEATGGFCQGLDLGIRVVMGNQHGLARLEQHLDLGDQGRLLLGSQGLWFGREGVVHLDYRRNTAQCIAHCDCSINAREGQNYNQKPCTNPSTNPVQYNCQDPLRPYRCHSCQKELSNETTFAQDQVVVAHAGTFLASGVAMTWIQSSSLNGLRDDIMAQTRGALEQEVSRSLQFQAERYAVQIEDQLQQAYQIPLGMAAQLEGSMAQPDQRLSRPQVELLLGSRLRQANGISSIYAQFEPNGYDGQDADWQTGASHSVAGKGSLEVYFTREQNGNIAQQTIDAATSDAKFDTSRNEFGIRNSEWYLCGRETRRPCLMEPYLYEISPGQKMLMTSLTVPVLKDGKFAGITGVDMNLPIFQQLAEHLGKSLYDNQAEVTLVSKTGFIVGSNRHSDKLGRP